MAAIHYLVMLLQSILLLWPVKASATELSCPQSCGKVRISYPFGIGEGCYFDKGFEVTCDNSSVPSKPYLSILRLEMSESTYYPSHMVVVNISESERVNKSLPGSPFSFSDTLNVLIAVGCDRWIDSATPGCQSFCSCDPDLAGGCCDFLCTLPRNHKFGSATIDMFSPRVSEHCRSIFMVDQTWLQRNYLKNHSVLEGQKQIPARLEWGKYKGTCVELFDSANTFCNKDNYCLIKLSSGHVCLCDSRISDSNQGCTGDLICNITSGKNCSGCPYGYSNVSYHYAYDDFPETICYSSWRDIYKMIKKSRVKFFIIIGCSAGLGTLLLLIGLWWSYKFVKRRKAVKLKERFFKRNGGLLLQKQLSANEGNIEKTRLFTSKELVKATDNFNKDRILGQGGQGTVYKGMLADGRIVAIKKSKIVDESKVAEFINEVVILSHIDHRNVVQLLGCCLETEVPLLVYEFISNGTLFQYIHDQNEEFPLTWELRLRIATEVANAVSYLHSAASMPVYHRDIKSTNILLDEKYQAKVSDFGTSRSVTVDHTHLTTQVRGTFGYVDPEYFQSSQFSEKSDVYSFGVVLAELLTGRKPIGLDFGEDRSLATYFLHATEENRLFEILDARVLKEGEKEEILMVANITKRCLHLNGKKRPTMREVAIQLAANIKESSGAPGVDFQQNREEMDCVKGEIPCNLETGSSSNPTSHVYPQISKKC